MDTLTGNSGFTIMVNVLDVAGFPVVHEAFDVKTQVIVLPFTGIAE